MERGIGSWFALGLGAIALVTWIVPSRGLRPMRKEHTVLLRVHDGAIELEWPNGVRDSRLYVPSDRDIRLRIRSQASRPAGVVIEAVDVRVRAIPDRQTEVVFRPPPPGRYELVLRPAGFAEPIETQLTVLAPPDFYRPDKRCCYEPPDRTLVEWGEDLFASNGCNACHADSDGPYGPTLTGLFLAERVLEDARVVRADLDYVRRAILEPQADIPAGWTHVVMPRYIPEGRQLGALLLYIAWLRDPVGCEPECDPREWPSRDVEPMWPAPISRKGDLLAGLPRRDLPFPPPPPKGMRRAGG